MIKPKTYFKQFPPKIAKKTVEQQPEQENVAVLPTTTRAIICF